MAKRIHRIPANDGDKPKGPLQTAMDDTLLLGDKAALLRIAARLDIIAATYRKAAGEHPGKPQLSALAGN